MRVSRRLHPWSDDLDLWWETGTVHTGHSAFAFHPWEWDDATAQELADEPEESLAKKKPPGFMPWPEGG